MQRRLTFDEITRIEPCEPSQHVFSHLYPQGIDITPANCREAFYKYNFNVVWLVGAGLLADRTSFLDYLCATAAEAVATCPEVTALDLAARSYQGPLTTRTGRACQWCVRVYRTRDEVQKLVKAGMLDLAARATERAADRYFWCRVSAGADQKGVEGEIIDWIAERCELTD